MESVITCPICYDQDRCFEDTQETFKSYMCFNCGYMSHSNYTKDKMDEVKHTSQLIRDLSIEDTERDLICYPSVVNMGKLGIIFPDGTPQEWVWKMARVVKIDEDEKKKYPIPNKPGEFYEERLVVEHAVEFGKFDFLGACRTMGIVKDGQFE